MNTFSGKMELSEIRKIKETAKIGLKEEFSFPKSVPILALVHIADEATRHFILEGLSAIGVANLAISDSLDVTGRRYAGVKPVITEGEMYAFDVLIYDGESEGIDIVKYMKAGVVPVTSDRTVFSGVFKDFNPMKFEGNGFYFTSNNPYCIFEKVISYLENIKFPEDRRILLKHVIETF
ncbi:MAG: hypothetical protein PHU93_01760 [Candidatus Gracilibacteria bacterium]|nr:hypothetical protein [Candidatus Gracilibacteria bacterium]